LTEAFDALAGTVFLLGFADEEAVERSAGDGDGDHDGSAPMVSPPMASACQAWRAFHRERLADQLRAAGIERGVRQSM